MTRPRRYFVRGLVQFSHLHINRVERAGGVRGPGAGAGADGSEAGFTTVVVIDGGSGGGGETFGNEGRVRGEEKNITVP